MHDIIRGILFLSLFLSYSSFASSSLTHHISPSLPSFLCVCQGARSGPVQRPYHGRSARKVTPSHSHSPLLHFPPSTLSCYCVLSPLLSSYLLSSWCTAAAISWFSLSFSSLPFSSLVSSPLLFFSLLFPSLLCSPLLLSPLLLSYLVSHC